MNIQIITDSSIYFFNNIMTKNTQTEIYLTMVSCNLNLRAPNQLNKKNVNAFFYFLFRANISFFY
jgi:hypothetical protein